MRDFGANVRLPRDAEQFVQRVQNSRAFITYMAGVDAVVSRRDLCQFDDFLRLRIRARQVDESRRKPDRAVLHRLLHQRFHLRQFLVRRRAIE